MSKEQQEPVVMDEQLDKALNEIDGLNVSDKEIYRVDSERFRFSNVEYKLIENHREAFDLELMEGRYTDYLLKYDYIVGDMSYQKLRLRGFYDDHRRGVPIDMKISNLEDYLVEYCSFGCQYFVFERVDKKEDDPDSYFKQKKSGRSNQKRQQKQKQQQGKSNRRNRGQQHTKKRHDRERQSQTKERQQARNKQAQPRFQVTKVEKQEQAPTENKTTKEHKQTTATPKRNDKKTFEIRKKTE